MQHTHGRAPFTQQCYVSHITVYVSGLRSCSTSAGTRIAYHVLTLDDPTCQSFRSSANALMCTGSAEAILDPEVRRSSTKLLIHFGDAPAHGTQYHNGRAGDDYPAGDPKGKLQVDMLCFSCCRTSCHLRHWLQADGVQRLMLHGVCWQYQ